MSADIDRYKSVYPTKEGEIKEMSLCRTKSSGKNFKKGVILEIMVIHNDGLVVTSEGFNTTMDNLELVECVAVNIDITEDQTPIPIVYENWMKIGEVYEISHKTMDIENNRKVAKCPYCHRS